MIIIGLLLIAISFFLRRNSGSNKVYKMSDEDKAWYAAKIAECDRNIAKDRRKRYGKIKKNEVKEYDQIWMN